jgi:hypothetical protein
LEVRCFGDGLVDMGGVILVNNGSELEDRNLC